MCENEKKKYHSIEMTTGSLWKNILLFSLPLMGSQVLEVLFNLSDVAVVGRFADYMALGAVGSTTLLVTLFTGILIGMGAGVNVRVAHELGAGNKKGIEETIHTSLLLCAITGLLVCAICLLFSGRMLSMMNTKPELIDQAILYMKIYSLGMPAMAIYNFGNGVLSAIGDTKRPLIYLSIAGVVNVLLNLFFVISLNMDVAGVALATVISQVISAGLVFWCLVKSEGALKLRIRDLRISKVKLKRIAKIGLPAGMQGAVFSISNVLIQSSVNSFGSIAMAGNTASQNIEGFIYNAMNAIYQTNLSFTSQNYGGRKYKRIGRITLTCVGVVTAVGLGMGLAAFAAGESLLRIYSSDPEVIQFGLKRMAVFGTTYFLCGIMDTMVGSIRGLGSSVIPMCVSIIGVCGLRVLWIFTVFQWSRSLTTLYLSYPVTWVVTGAVHIACFLMLKRKLPKEDGE